ncbi:PKD domain-containing protein [Cellulomonas sp. URHB0016]
MKSTCRYTPAPNWSGTDSVGFGVSDGRGGTATGTATVTVRPVNDLPAASFTLSAPTPVTAPVTVTVDGTASADVEGIAAWSWAFGDGGTASGSTATHRYAAAGTFEMTLTATDSDGATATSRRSVTVAAPAPLRDGVTLTRTGSQSCRYSGETSSGNVELVRSGTKITHVRGTAVVGTATVTFNVVIDKGLGTGTTRLADAARPADLVTLQKSPVTTTGTSSVGGTASWTASGVRQQLVWSVVDRA